MCRIIICFLFYLTISSCSDLKQEHYPNGDISKEYYILNNAKQGVYKEFYKSGGLKIIHNFDKGIKEDSSIFYYKNPKNKIKFIRYWLSKDSIKEINYFANGDIKSQGILSSKLLRKGKWIAFDKDKNSKKSTEYIIINKNTYVNQEWYMNSKGDTLFYPTHYFKVIKNKDTFSIKNPFRAIASLKIPLFKNKKSQISVVVAKEGFNFNSDFSNEKEIETDTFYNLTEDVNNQKWFSKESYPYTVAFGRKFKTKGKKMVRGYILEYYEQAPDSNGTSREEHKKYFEIPIYIKDSLGKIPDFKNTHT